MRQCSQLEQQHALIAGRESPRLYIMTSSHSREIGLKNLRFYVLKSLKTSNVQILGLQRIFVGCAIYDKNRI